MAKRKRRKQPALEPAQAKEARVKALLDRLAELLKGAPKERLDAFENWLEGEAARSGEDLDDDEEDER